MSDRCVVLLGTPVDDVTLPEAIDRIGEMVVDGRRTGRTHQVATVNVDFVVNASHDRSLRSIMDGTDLSIPDGMGVVWGARVVGIPIRERTSGVDLVPALAERAVVEDWRICLFGAAAGVAEGAARQLRERFPGSDVLAMEAPAIDADGRTDTATLDALRSLCADVVAVALGNPKQERWIDRHGRDVGAPVCIGVGGALDFLTGGTQRAPAWMQRAGMEWIHRTISEPRRLARRYAKDLVVFGPGLLAQAWRGRRHDPSSSVMVERQAGVTLIDVSTVRSFDNLTAADLTGHLRAARRRGDLVEVVGARPSALASAARLGLAITGSVLPDRPHPVVRTGQLG